MPHIHLETTADLPENGNVPDILEALVATLAVQPTVKADSIKAYHTLRVNWAVGEGHPPGFAHVTLKVLDGREASLRETFADALIAVLREHFAQSLAEKEVAVTLEVVEMATGTYRKVV